MDTATFRDRLLDACQLSTPGRTRARYELVSGWLRSVIESDAGITEYGERQSVTDRRSLLRAALGDQVVPTTTPARLAAAARAVGVNPGDRGALIRLAWTLRPYRQAGALRFSNAGDYFGDLVDETIRLMANEGGDPAPA